MPPLNTATIGMAVTPTVVSTLFSHYLDRKKVRQKPTERLSYDEGLHLIRSFLAFASTRPVEELQAFTGQWVPHPTWVRVDEVEIPEDKLSYAANLLHEQLGPEGIRRVGGREWWQWRRPKSPLKAEWIEMKADYEERKENADPGNRVMFYIHGGAYFFGSVNEHRFMIQRHARKLRARAFAPEYRLAPQFPFPCGLQDCLAAYLYLLTQQEPKTIILAGDSAGGGMVLSLLVILRDQGIPLPAGAVLISPWVDLTHSFPSVAGDCPLDYVPPSGFHHRPSRAWPPPDEDEMEELKKIAIEQKKGDGVKEGSSDSNSGIPTIGDVLDKPTRLSLMIDGQQIDIKEQIQMYTTNEMLNHPLVSPVLQPTLGGLPPLLIMTGGAEILRDEQIYLAHKCANPEQYLPPEAMMDEPAWAQVKKYPPTDVQLQVWDDLCHVAPTLSFTRPAKYQFRAIAQFGAWALARAQRTEIDILDDDDISVISGHEGEDESDDATHEPAVDPTQPYLDPKPMPKKKTKRSKNKRAKTVAEKENEANAVGKAGDPLPPFHHHMIRQRVTTTGLLLPLPEHSDLPACCVDRNAIGVIKPGPVRKWLAHKKKFDSRFASTKSKVHKQRIKDMREGGYEVFPGGDVPPPSALAGRRKIGHREEDLKKDKKSWGLSLWGVWGSKHDKMTVARGEKADRREVSTKTVQAADGGEGARSYSDIKNQEGTGVQGKTAAGVERPGLGTRASGSRYKSVADQGQTGEHHLHDDDEHEHERPQIEDILAYRKGELEEQHHQPPEVGATGKRPIVDGLATPFSLGKKAETASMITLQSGKSRMTAGTSILQSPPGTSAGASRDNLSLMPSGADDATSVAEGDGDAAAAGTRTGSALKHEVEADGEKQNVIQADEHIVPREVEVRNYTTHPLDATRGIGMSLPTPLTPGTPGTLGSRPGLDRFVTADEFFSTGGTPTPTASEPKLNVA
ncbi:hypothetical protein NEUTE1DRAFT_148450 [Neurospora tetrasperma FGSC 2508]|uniref:Alpha/beta hydrolase fold-3 domain-containing protein n=1 Tax=Neurospora tetrasperma (strain FGSC 2508 / ATCC MYA-4615 / P0657) TaxID=510951 RepID=F8MVT3_NEUT8|nr:uncharacterized protein NEUTE1DRAFT_148450 [Neurospora tetrasperma FGSC 2508]EGO53981.1 hypothetical protein NEUTE1DRAFT_148450 [Neurospora tetrasperma FGSC 2508]EGZ68598.1 alpha/beta-hydrolase [Neurospora tetrasperma FGSC 2509]